MLMILKTFKLSKSLVYLLYVLLIITTVISIDIKDEQANPSKTDDENNNPDKDIQGDSNLITSNINSPAENDRSIKNNVLQGIFSRMSNWNNKPSQIKSSETNIVKNQQPELYNENDPTEITLGLSSEPETNGVTGLEEVSDKIIDDKETKKTKKKKKKNKKQKKTEDIETKSKLNVMNTNGDELSIVGSEEKNIRRLDNIKYQQPELYEENDPTKMTLDLSHDLTSTEKDVELDNKKTKTNSQKEETDLISAESKAIGSDNIKSTIEQISKLSDPEKNPIDDIVKDTEKTTMMGVDQKDLTLSPLEDVGIIKIKNSENATSEAIRKEKKKTKFIEFTHSGGSARIYCTFLGDVLKMYNKVKKRFVGHFCHAIVIGTPIILKQNQIHLSDNMKNHLNKIEPYKQGSLLIVIMKFSNYKDWKKTLANNVNIKHLVANIIHMVKTYKIDGIEFSNLQPIVGEDTVDTHMMNNLLKFFKKLLNVARHNHNHNLKIGITIHLNSQWITPSFTSFDQLNKMVTWYAYETISMVTCSSEYKDAGTSPLIGDVSLTNAYNTLAKTEIEMAKVVVGIQLFPNKVNELEPLTYEELCSTPKDSWDEWCAAHPEKLRLKGIFLRNNEIGGVQLFYMHSDDYRSTCGCYSFPLTRALLRGLINTQTEEQCDFNTAHN